MKKTQLLAGMLAVTAGLAASSSTVLAASSKKSEKQFPQEFALKSKNLVRAKVEDGGYSIGHLYMTVQQTPMTPTSQNLLHGEMTVVQCILKATRPFTHITTALKPRPTKTLLVMTAKFYLI